MEIRVNVASSKVMELRMNILVNLRFLPMLTSSFLWNGANGRPPCNLLGFMPILTMWTRVA